MKKLLNVFLVASFILLGMTAIAQPKYSVYEAVGDNNLLGAPLMSWTAANPEIIYNKDRTRGTMKISMYHEANEDGAYVMYSFGRMETTRDIMTFHFDEIYGDPSGKISKDYTFYYKTKGKKITLTDGKGNSYEFIYPKD
jgi:hypothetical protein